MIYKLTDDVTSNKKRQATKKDPGFIFYAKSGSFATIISNHGDIVICESLKRIARQRREDEDVYLPNGNKFSTKLSNLTKIR